MIQKIVRYALAGLVAGLCCLVCVHGLAFADGGAPNLAYVAGGARGVSVIDIGQQRVTSTLAAGTYAQMLYLSVDGRFLYVAQPTLNRVTMLGAKTGQVICSAQIAGSPSLLAFDAGTSALFIAGNQSMLISKMDTSDCHIMGTYKARGVIYGMATAEVALGTGDNQLWVAEASGLQVFGTQTGRDVATIAMAGQPRLLSIPSGGWVYVTTLQGALYGVDLNTYKQLALLSGDQFGTMDFDQVTGEIYVPDQLHKQLDVLTPLDVGATTAPHEPIHTYQLGATPRSVAVTSDGAFAFVALSTGEVAMLDLAARQTVRTIPVGGDPRFVITGLYPPIIGTTPQQTSLVMTILPVVSYLLVACLILLPLWFIFRQRKKLAVKQEVE